MEEIEAVCHEESLWMKVRGWRGRDALYIGCVYMPADSCGVSTIEESYQKLKCANRRGGL